jgi:hypothetical protein
MEMKQHAGKTQEAKSSRMVNLVESTGEKPWRRQKIGVDQKTMDILMMSLDWLAVGAHQLVFGD